MTYEKWLGAMLWFMPEHGAQGLLTRDPLAARELGSKY